MATGHLSGHLSGSKPGHVSGHNNFKLPTGGRGLPVPSLLTSGSSTADATSIATASVAPGASRAIYAAVVSTRAAGSIATPTCSGNGLTWVQVDTQDIALLRRLTVFRAMGSPSAGAVTFDFGGQTQDSFCWAVIEVTNVNTSGANGLGATVQAVKSVLGATNTTMTNTLAALEHANNVHLAFLMTRSSGHAAATPDADFAELSDNNVASTAALLESEWARNQTPCSPSWGAADLAGMISIEVKAN